MSLRWNFCRSVPPEFLRSFLSMYVLFSGWYAIFLFAPTCWMENYNVDNVCNSLFTQTEENILVFVFFLNNSSSNTFTCQCMCKCRFWLSPTLSTPLFAWEDSWSPWSLTSTTQSLYLWATLYGWTSTPSAHHHLCMFRGCPRQNYTLLEQRGMVFDIFINCW